MSVALILIHLQKISFRFIKSEIAITILKANGQTVIAKIHRLHKEIGVDSIPFSLNPFALDYSFVSLPLFSNLSI